MLTFIRYLKKQTSLCEFILWQIVVIYLLFQNKLCSYINEINQFRHHTKHDTNTYELQLISGKA